MNPLVKEINQELENLGQELASFKSLVSYLDNAKDIIENAKEKLDKTDQKYLENVTRLSSTYKDFEKIQASYDAFYQKIDGIKFPEQFAEIHSSITSLEGHLEDFKTSSLSELKSVVQIIENSNIDENFSSFSSEIEFFKESNVVLKNNLSEKINGLQSLIKGIAFSTRLDKLDISVTESLSSIQSTQASVKKSEKNVLDINTRIDKLSKETDLLKGSNVQHRDLLSGQLNELQHQIVGLNFSIRIDKLDSSIAGLLSSVQNIQTSIDKSERYIISQIESYSKSQTDALLGLQEELGNSMNRLEQEMASSSKRNIVLHIITWLLVVIVGIILFVLK